MAGVLINQSDPVEIFLSAFDSVDCLGMNRRRIQFFL